MPGTCKRAEVAEPGLARRPAVIGGHVAFGVIKIHGTQTRPEREDISDLADSDRGPQPRRYLIAVDRCDLGGIQHRLDAYLTSAAAQELHQLVEGERVAVLGPHDRMPGT